MATLKNLYEEKTGFSLNFFDAVITLQLLMYSKASVIQFLVSNNLNILCKLTAENLLLLIDYCGFKEKPFSF